MNENIPVVPGFTLKRDPLTDEWIATSASGRFTIRGWTQRELTDARWALWRRLIADFQTAIAEVYPGNNSLRILRPALRDTSHPQPIS